MTDSNGATAPKRNESDVYDRQIRLWGAEAQAKISKAQVLYVHCTGVSSEILKNLVLAGVHATICDARPYPDAVAETPSFFLLERNNSKRVKYASVGHAMKAAVEELNPLLGECPVLDTKVEDFTAEKLAKFDIVICSRIGMIQANRIAKATVDGGGKFYMVDCFGWMGAAVVDLGEGHSYRKEVGAKNELSDVMKLQDHVPLEEMWKVPLSDLKMKRIESGQPPLVWTNYLALLSYHAARDGTWPSETTAADFETFCQDEWTQKAETPASTDFPGLARVALAEVSPVCAILGGVMGNEVIKSISGKGEPANNAILLNALDGKCRHILCKKK